ncbi:glycerol dehydrogenase [Acinetobacter calcoaceticus]|uniref:Glycerol dehydrogenase n=1 Tax=Acinetobacter calcoaceticus TaxID=471 RepID=A0A4R1XWT8_ACICA|nr:glycerol dehydrogenase [Acinetobacter calcoaceticus]
MLKIMGFPGEYVQGPHALAQLGRILIHHKIDHIAIIYDHAVDGPILQRATENLAQESIKYFSLKFSGECSYRTINHACNQIARHYPQAIVALGGGKAIDTAKAVAKNLDLQIVICPTIASNDAPTSRLIMIYDELHQVEALDKIKSNPDIVVVDTDVIAHAPAQYFSAGIGDAISKMFEANQCRLSNGLNSFGTPPLPTAMLLADQTYYNLLQFATTALQDVKQQKLTEHVEKVVETTVLLSGLGFESGGLSLARALVCGLAAVPQLSTKLHGELAAYGTVIHALLENRSDQFMQQLTEFLIAVDLPICLADLGYECELSQHDLELIITNTLNHASSANFVPKISADHLKQALYRSNACLA